MSKKDNQDDFSILMSFYKQILSKNSPIEIQDDKQFRKENQEQLCKRDSVYTDLLDNFEKIYINRQNKKEKYKWVFCILIIVCLFIFIAGIIVILSIVVDKINAQEINGTFPIIITAIAGILSSLIAIPLTISKYLFNPEEDKEITEMIIKMQEQDLSNRNLIMKVLDTLENDNKSSQEKNEEE